MDKKINTIEEMNSLCRTCLSIINNTNNIFKEKSSNGETYAAILRECTSVQLIKDDGLPLFICRKCAFYLESLIIFRETCVKSDITLKSIYSRILNTNNSKQSVASNKSSTPEILELEIKTPRKDTNKPQFFSNKEDCKLIKKKCNENLKTYYSLSEVADIRNENKNIKVEYKSIQPKIYHQNKKQTIFYKKKLGGSKYKCEFCNKKFSVKSNLAPHRRIHTGEKPFMCGTCGKSFTQKVNLQTHIKTHFKNLKSYKCNICAEVFSQKSHFINHRKMHQAEASFSCYMCGISFSQIEMLEEHNFIHHEKKIEPPPVEICKIVQVRSLKTNHGLQYDHNEAEMYNCSEDRADFEIEEVYI